MINMKNIGSEHILCFDTNTDKSHLFPFPFDYLEENQAPILTFDSSAICTGSKGKLVCSLSINSENY